MKCRFQLLLLAIVAIVEVSANDRAQWITAVASESAPNEWICFRRDFAVDRLPTTAPTRIAVDSKYWLWINGELVIFEGGVKRGPTPNDTYVDEVDIAPYLRRGENSIGLLLWHFGKEGFSHNPSGRAAMFFESLSSDGFELVSDDEWRSMLHPAYYTPSGELPEPNYRLPESNVGYDARLDIGEWWIGDFDGEASVELGEEGSAPWNRLLPRVIPQWRDYGVKPYVECELRRGESRDTLVCKLPYNTQVTPWLRVESAKGGERIVMLTDHHNGGGAFNVSAEYLCRAGSQSYESLGWMNGHNVYYVIPKGVAVTEVRYRETVYDTDFAGAFYCDDPALNRLWEMARRTLLVTMRDTYMDCPDRERSQWWGDAVNESGETFYALCPKSHLLTRKAIHELINWQRDDSTLYSPVPSSNWASELPGQMLASVGYYGFWNYYMHTADRQTIEDVYGGVRKYIDVWQLNADRTVKFRRGNWAWGDWGKNVDKQALYNAWYYIALKGAQQMADLLGYADDVADYGRRMESLRQAFNDRFWTGSGYKHPAFRGVADDRVQALAVVSGLADESRYPQILKLFESTEFASPYMEKYVTEAYFMMGHGREGLARMKRRFASMLNSPDATTLFEGWEVGAKDFGGGSANHAWSGGGLTILSQYLCGVAPVEAGYKVFRVAPQCAGVERASCRVESVAGTIETSFVDTANSLTLRVTVPESTRCEVVLPAGDGARVVCAGGDATIADGSATLTLGAGRHKIVVKK